MYEKYGELFLESVEERRIWRSGKGKSAYVTALPSDWAKPIVNSDDTICVSKVKTNRVRSLFLAPKNEYKKRCRDPLKIEKDNSTLLLNEVVTAYLADYAEVRVEFPVEKPQLGCVEVLGKIPSKLFGVTIVSDGMNNFRIRMSTAPEPIHEMLEEMFNKYTDLYKINFELMRNTRNVMSDKQMDGNRGIIMMKEQEIDAYSFLIKRLLNRLLYTPWLSEELGIEDLAQIVPYTTLNANLERLGDLQVEIFKILPSLVEELGKNAFEFICPESGKYGLSEYYDDAYKMVQDAYTSQDDVERLVTLLSTKGVSKTFNENGKEISLAYRPGYIEAEERKIIYDTIEKSRNNRNLTCLEYKIWGMTGNATNIAEAWSNMRLFKG